MKNVFFIFTFSLISFVAKAQDVLQVYKGGILQYKQEMSKIDSIVFVKSVASDATVTDIDGNIYHTVQIGAQTWMVENLNTTRYRNGDLIKNAISSVDWYTSPTNGLWCNYDNNEALGTKYGKLYNWYAAKDPRNIAPVGWHVPSEADWLSLVSYVTSNKGHSISLGKALAAQSGWAPSSIVNAVGNDLTLNNSSGFSALPGGCRDPSGVFGSINGTVYFWYSAEYSSTDGYFFDMHTGSTSERFYNYSNSKKYGFSIRCIKDY